MPAEPLAIRTRNGRAESVHHGHLVVLSADGERVRRGNPDAGQYARSTMKPFQALPLVMTGAAEAYGLSERCLAIACASHAGEDAHREAVSELLHGAGLVPEQLQCGVHAPLNEQSAAKLVALGRSPDVLHNNCSGKHAGMLAVCRHQGWPLETYRDPEHPLQRRIRSTIADLAEMPEAALVHGVDGCGVPVWYLPLTALARLFLMLGTPSLAPSPFRDALTRLANAMASHPALVSGPGRLDTELMTAGSGALLAKIGGEGVHAGGWRDRGLAWAIKVDDGNRRAIGPALARALAQAGAPLPEAEALAAHVAAPTTNHHGQVLGVMEAGW
ncbi:MAG TPA: asparaginase [Oscillatoriaceae cyanobacterium]